MKKNLAEKLVKLNIVIASHISASGPALDLEEYLKDKSRRLLFIGHPFASKEGEPSFYRLYQNGVFIRKGEAARWKLPGILIYIREAASTLFWILRSKGGIDLYVGSDNFLAYLGVILKGIGKVKKVVFYTIDYVPKRFDDPFLNRLYHFLDFQSVKNADIVWNLSERIAEARKKDQRSKEENIARQIVVPVGIWLDRTKNKVRDTQKDPGRIVYLGHLIAKQGLQAVIDAMADVIKVFPKANLVVVGTGPYERELRKRAKKIKLGSKVKFLGFIKSHEDVESELAKSSIAVATYVPSPESFTYFTDPGKIKSYLAAGLPTILTDVPQNAKDLEKNECGIIVDYNPNAIAKGIKVLFGNRPRLKRYAKNALEYVSRFDWNKIFEKALKDTFKN